MKRLIKKSQGGIKLVRPVIEATKRLSGPFAIVRPSRIDRAGTHRISTLYTPEPRRGDYRSYRIMQYLDALPSNKSVYKLPDDSEYFVIPLDAQKRYGREFEPGEQAFPLYHVIDDSFKPIGRLSGTNYFEGETINGKPIPYRYFEWLEK